ncbi:MAG: M3 family oligoendopeptidase [Cyclobacteriaceae bacterium]
MNIEIPQRNARVFLPEEFNISSWEKIQPYLEELLNREISNEKQLKKWFNDRSELEAVLSEDLAWRYIKMTCDTTDKQLKDNFNFFVSEIEPKIAPYSDKLNKKALESPYLDEIQGLGYQILIRNMKKSVEIFREENIPINAELSQKSHEYGGISGAMTVEWEGQELTLQQAAVKLQDTDRRIREKVYQLVVNRRLQDKEKLDELFSVLIKLRHQLAQNADFDNYRDYMFAAMHRFDYKPQDCFDFHESVTKCVVPLLNELASERKEKLGVDSLRPWDKAVDVTGKAPLKPFDSPNDLVDKTIECFSRLDPFLGQCLAIMNEMGHLDLDSRKGKAPGGYNYPLMEIGVPFIFMNATSTLRDLVTIVHEGGHAVHSFLTRDLELSDFKSTPSEVAELASMSMELLSMDHWDLFFNNEEDLKRAKKEHLEQIIETLPWVATIDKFQHWIYENPEHSLDQRKEAWNDIFDQFSDSITDWTGHEEKKDYLWQKQLHLFEVPFYYIEYGMAQLGAVAIWKNYQQDKQKGLQGYMAALKLGNLKTIPEIYEAANIKFDFSPAYISELMDFVKRELNNL